MKLGENSPFPHMMYRIDYLPKGSDRVRSLAVRDDRLLIETDHLKNDLRCEILNIDCLGCEKENKR